MQVELRLGGLITLRGREIALGQTCALLEGIADERSVRGAAERLKLSYRSAWGRVVALEKAIGRPVVVKTKGHGTVLTDLGEQLRQSLRETLRQFEPALRREQQALERRLADLLGPGEGKLKLAVSHDPLLLQVLCARSDVDVSVAGSEIALNRLLLGQVDVAGCHFGPQENGALPVPLRLPGIIADPVLDREQGFIVAPDNPLGLRTVADIARLQARFINRQRGSGTRAWFDRLLLASSLTPGEIVGYGVEEFTHQAVAALVASGTADVGFGVRGAAVALGLGFVPVGRETYYLVRREGFNSPVLEEVAGNLRARFPEDKGRPSESSVRTPMPVSLLRPPG